MPRLSLYRPEKGNDYKFFDQRISEMFTVGGVDVNVHKYVGPMPQANASPASTGITAIQDLLFLENRDRKYDTSVYTLRTNYRLNDNDFDLTQFGLFLTGDTMFATFHLNDMVETLGRKLIVGDVLEMPNMKELYPLDDGLPVALKRYYTVQDASRSAEGYAPTWYPHLWRVKLQPLVDSQEYKDIINQIQNQTVTDPLTGNTSVVTTVLSTYDKYIGINDAIVARAEQDVPKSGYDTTSFYTVPTNPDGSPADPEGLEASTVSTDASDVTDDTSSQTVISAEKVTGYLTEDALPPNGTSVAAGIAFPSSPTTGAFFLRLDYIPNRLFRYDGRRWVKVEDAVRTNLTPNPNNVPKTQLEGFINDAASRMSGSIAWDAIRVTDPYTPNVSAKTASFTFNTRTVVTKVPYVSTYGIRTYLNGILITNTKANASGNIGFTVSNTLHTNDVLEYTVYAHVAEERQGLSQILRPTADN